MTALSRGQRESLDYQLRGRTLDVYILLLKSRREMGVREIQRELGYSTPSIAFDCLKKLVTLEVVKKGDSDRYYIAKKVDSGILQFFITVAGLTLPRMVFYAIFFAPVALGYLLFEWGSLDILGLVSTVGAEASLLYEALRVWRRSPFGGLEL